MLAIARLLHRATRRKLYILRGYVSNIYRGSDVLLCFFSRRPNIILNKGVLKLMALLAFCESNPNRNFCQVGIDLA
jgi:hypothetical protein